MARKTTADGLSFDASRAYGREPLIVSPRGTDGEPNKFFHMNLPWDYDTLDSRGMRQARINGIRLQGPSPDHFVRAWALLRTHYLRSLPDGAFYKGFVPSPQFHYDIVRDLAAYQRNAWAAPRGSAKSTVLGKECPLLTVLGRPNFEVMIVLAKNLMIQRRFSQFSWLLQNCPAIYDDFGKLRPPRGQKMWNLNVLQLTNGSQLIGLPVEGKLLGERPDLILADDPEHDKSMVANPNPTALVEGFEKLLFGVIMPMCHKGTCLGWIGTLLDARSFLYRVVYSQDKKFGFWNRRILTGKQEDGSSIWEERWSPEDLKKLEEVWGKEFFQTHMQNSPGSEDKTLLEIHPEYCTYTVEDVDDSLGWEPLKSNAVIHSVRPVKGSDGEWRGDKICRPYGETVSKMQRIMTVDLAWTVSARSDFSCCHVMGFENSDDYKDTLWSLDMWLGKKEGSDVIEQILHMARRWKVRLIAVEAIGLQQQISDQVSLLADATATGPDGWRPSVYSVRYPTNLPKANRIAGLKWRFDKWRVKLPEHLKGVWPYKEFFYEVENFTLSLAKLPHDDALDTLAMQQFVGRNKSVYSDRDAGEKERTVVEMLKDGELFHEISGIPLVQCVDPNDVPIREMTQRIAGMEEDGVIWRGS